MATSLADIRARIAAQDNKTKSGTSSQSDNSIYPQHDWIKSMPLIDWCAPIVPPISGSTMN